MPDSKLLRALANSFISGEQTVEEICSRASELLGKRLRWMGPLARRYLRDFQQSVRPRQREVIQFFRHDRGFQRVCSAEKLTIASWLHRPRQMQPSKAAESWDVPRITSIGELADWLGLTVGELQWFADRKGLALRRKESKLRHYSYRFSDENFIE
jgi:hypothetical protein